MADEEVVTAPEVVVLKVANCESLSGRSVLTYHIGYKGVPCEEEKIAFRNGIHIRIHENSGKGLFSDEWVPFSELQQVFTTEESEIPISSASLNAIFEGKSVNTAGFLLAVLKAEGLVKQLVDKRRSYACAKADTFLNDIRELAISAIPSMEVEKDDTAGKAERKGKGQKG